MVVAEAWNGWKCGCGRQNLKGSGDVAGKGEGVENGSISNLE